MSRGAAKRPAMGGILAQAAAVLALSALLYAAVELRHGPAYASFRLRNYAAVSVLMALAWIAHRRRMAGMALGPAAYLRFLLTGRTDAADTARGKASGTRPRIAYLDFLRVLAVFMAVAIHAILASYDGMSGTFIGREILFPLSVMFTSCNVLFVLLSGALLLDGREEPLWSFYRKKFLKILIPCLLYFLFYCFYAYGLTALYPGNWKNLLVEFIGNSSGLTPHFWLIHVILTVYLSAPFLKVMAKAMSESMLRSMAFAILAVNAAFVFGGWLGITFTAAPLLVSWEAVFLLGYFFKSGASDRYCRLFYAGALISAAFIVLVLHAVPNYTPLVYNNVPPILLISGYIFLFFKRRGGSWFSKVPAAAAMLAKHSFSILMIHWFILYEVVGRILGINAITLGTGAGLIPGLVLCVALTVGVSAVFAVIFDNTVVAAAEEAVAAAGRMLRILKKR